jgi:TonB family protein
VIRFDYAYAPPAPRSAWLFGAATLALALEAVLLIAVGWQHHWIAHPQKTGLDAAHYVEAEIFRAPEPAHLVEEKKITVPKTTRETTLSKTPAQGKASKSNETSSPEENLTESGPAPLANHGPIAVFTPTPVIPEYLRAQELKASAVIDFFVTAQGGVNPQLVGSTGNEELDALAISTASRWQFRPAEREHKPIDAKVRLRIVFEVK